MASYRPYKKTSNVTTEDLPLDAETVKGVDVVAQINAIKDGSTLDSFGDVENALANLPSGDSVGYVELSSTSVTLTDEQYTECQKDICIIKYGQNKYIKQYVSNGSIVFEQITNVSFNSTNSLYTVSSNYIVVSQNKSYATTSKNNQIYTSAQTDTLLGSKQPTLVSGTNIKTINNQSLLGSGNIDLLDVEIVLFGAGGTLTDAQYNKLSNKNCIIRTSPYQMQGDPQILYKVEENDTQIEFQGKVYSYYDSTYKTTSLMRSIITITKSTKAWQKKSNSYVALYDYSQIDTLLATKQPLLPSGNADFLASEYNKTLNILPNEWQQGEIRIDSSINPATTLCYNILNLESGTYTIKINNRVNNGNLLIYNLTNQTTLVNWQYNATFTISSNARIGINYAHEGASTSVTPSEVKTYNIMLNEGTTALAYQPYYAPAQFTNNEGMLLKNEYNKTLNLQSNVIYDTEETYSNNIQLEQGTYTLSYSGITMSSGAWQIIINGSAITTQQLASSTSITFTINTTSNYRFYANRNMSGAKFMLNEGSTALPYAEYGGGRLAHINEARLLWENGSPNSSFSAQTINTLPMDEFTYIIIGYKTNMNSSQAIQYEKVKYAKGYIFQIYNAWAGGTYSYSREFRFDSTYSTQMYIYPGYKENDSYDNERIIPVAIYGTNVL